MTFKKPIRILEPIWMSIVPSKTNIYIPILNNSKNDFLPGLSRNGQVHSNLHLFSGKSRALMYNNIRYHTYTSSILYVIVRNYYETFLHGRSKLAVMGFARSGCMMAKTRNMIIIMPTGSMKLRWCFSFLIVVAVENHARTAVLPFQRSLRLGFFSTRL